MSVITVSTIGVLISLIVSILIAFLIWKFLLVRVEKELSKKWWMKLVNILILAVITIMICYFLIQTFAIGGTGCLIDPTTGKCTA